MKRANVLLVVVAVILLAANIYLRTRAVPQPVEAASLTESQTNPAPRANATAPVQQPAEPLPALRWDQMETADYKAYIANLRRVGFPEELIREIIIADVNKLYADRESPLKTKPVPHDAPLAERRRKPTVQDVENLLKLREIQIEKHQLLEQLLGVKVPREIIRTPNSRNYEAADYAARQLPPEKQQAALEIYELEILKDDLNQARGLRGAEEMAAYRQVNEERDAALRQLLTPDEFERFMMNAIPPGAEMQRRIMGMEPTDDELLAMWKVTHEQWKEQGGVFGRWRADRVPEEQIRAADEKLEQNLQRILGPDRYLDYQLATSGTGQQLKNFANRYNLPRETLSNAFQLQKEIDSLRKYDPLGPADPEQRLIDAENRLQQTLGADHYHAWLEGRNRKYELQP